MLLVAETLLVATGALSLARAAAVFLVIEGLLALCALGQLAVGLRCYRQQRSGGADREAALAAALRAVLPSPVAALVVHELAIGASLVLYLRRRRSGVGPGVVPIGYDLALRPLSLTFLVLSVLELVVVEFAVPWPTVRLVLLVGGGWTVLLSAGLAAANVVRPHLVTSRELRLRLRSGTWADVSVPLDRIATVTARRRSASDRTASVVEDALVLGIGGGTTVDVQLREPTVLTVGRRSATVRAVRFAADDPRAAVTAIRAALAAAVPVAPEPS